MNNQVTSREFLRAMEAHIKQLACIDLTLKSIDSRLEELAKEIKELKEKDAELCGK